MSQIFFCSDTHFNHNKPFLYEPRGFTSIEEHDAAIIKNWNEVVANNDIVYVLGDVMMGNDYDLAQEKLRQLNGTLVIFNGNHESDRKLAAYKKLPNVKLAGWSTVIKYGKWRFYLSHFPTMVDNFDEKHKFYCLHGHTHDRNKYQFIKNCCYNVALDAQGNTPVSIDQVKEDLIKIREGI